MTGRPISFDELAARMKTAADVELFAINQLELQASRASTREPANPAIYQLTVDEARRQAAALGLAHQIARALARRPDLALGLGLDLAAEVLA
ncbi:hypothetical protein ACFPOB_20635 [Bosea eneae]|uniref:Uncharacterized protein n=1 Tax=Bosea eneae TaxID=151454 RepID=A0ABW0IXR9_9HYPH